MGVGGGDYGEGLDALVFAIAAIGVGIEVADVSAFNGGPCAGRGRQTFGRWESEGQFANAAGLGEADGGSGSVADTVHRGLGLLAEADDEKAPGGETRGRMEQQRFVGTGLVFAAGEDGGRGCGNAGIGGEEHGRGLGIGPFCGLCIDGKNSQQLCRNLRKGSEREFGLHLGYCFILGAAVTPFVFFG